MTARLEHALKCEYIPGILETESWIVLSRIMVTTVLDITPVAPGRTSLLEFTGFEWFEEVECTQYGV